jgi:hypothetical protein
MAKQDLEKHWERHVVQGHIAKGSKVIYQRAEARPLERLPLFDAIYEYSASGISDAEAFQNDGL